MRHLEGPGADFPAEIEAIGSVVGGTGLLDFVNLSYCVLVAVGVTESEIRGFRRAREFEPKFDPRVLGLPAGVCDLRDEPLPLLGGASAVHGLEPLIVHLRLARPKTVRSFKIGERDDDTGGGT